MATLPPAQTITGAEADSIDSQPHRRFLSKPLFLHASQFHAALFPD
jgi:hypothetical protein